MNIAQLLMSNPVKSDVMNTGVANSNSVANFKNIYNQIVATKDEGANHSILLTNEELSLLEQVLQVESLTELSELLTVESTQLLQSTSLEDVTAATGLDLAQLQQILDKLTSNNVTQPKTSSNSLLPTVNTFTPLQQVDIRKESMNQNVSELSSQLESQKAVEQLFEGQSQLLDVTQLLQNISNYPPELQKEIKKLVEDQPQLLDVMQLLQNISNYSPELQKAVEQLIEDPPKLMNEHQLIIKLFMKKIGERFPQLQPEVNKFIEDIPKFTDINQLLQMIDDRFPQLELEIQKFVESEPISLDTNQFWKEMDKLFSQIQVKDQQPIDKQPIDKQPVKVDIQQLVKQQNPTAIQLQRDASSDSINSLDIAKDEELSKQKEVVNEIQQQFTNIEELFVWMEEKAPQLLSQLTASLKGEYSVTPKEAKQVLQFLKVAELLNQQTVSAANPDAMTTVKVTELFSKIVTELQTMSEPTTKPKLQVFQQVIHRVMPKLEESVATETVVSNTQSSKTETITITLPSAKPAQSEALLKEMQAILNKSQISNVAGLTKLAIKLYPENLGTIRIEIVQQNGVLTARLLASTQAGKELLDQNVHQLKQAFVQQNIQVERLDIAQSLQDPNRSGREQSFSNNFSNQQRQQEDDEQQNDEQEEVLSFKDLLATEEVD